MTEYSGFADWSVGSPGHQRQAEAIRQLGGLAARLDELEQKAVRRGGSYDGGMGGGSSSSLGASVTNHPRFRELIGSTGRRGTAMIPVQSGDLSMITTIAGSAGSMLSVDRRVAAGDIILAPQRRLTVRALLGKGQTTSKSVEFSREDVFTDNTAMVSEAGTKPESEITFEPAVAEVKKIANTVTASAEALADAPALNDVIDTTLRYGLALMEETQLLYGDGTGPNLYGIIPQAVPFAPAFVPDLPNMLDTLALAILQCELALLPASGIVVHPTDWRKILLTKDDQGRYLIGSGPGVAAPAQLWGLPVSVTPAVAANSWVVGAFELGATIFDREDAHIEVSTEHADYFKRNLALILAEERLALAVKRPSAFVYGQFAPVSG